MIRAFRGLNATSAPGVTEVELAALTPDGKPRLYNYAIQADRRFFATRLLASARV